MSRLNTLFLCTRIPYPLDTGGKQRTFHLLRALAMRHDVTLVTFGSGARPQELPHDLLSLCRRIVVLHNPLIDGHSLLRAGSSLARLEPYTVSKYRQEQLPALLLRMHRERPFSLVHCDQLHLGRALAVLPDVPSVLDEHNIESLLWQRLAHQSRGIKRVAVRVQQQLMARHERRICELAGGVITCSAEDRRWVLRQTRQRRVRVIPNGVDTAEVAPSGAVERDPRSLVFVGSMDWLPNAEGVARFHERIWPRLRRRFSDLRCHVVGGNPSPRLQQIAAREAGFHVTGRVDDVRPFIERAAVYVVPLYIGGGTRLKILEAFSMGKAVVSTALGAEGIEYVDGEHLAIARDDAHFVELTADLLGAPRRAARMGQAARRLVEQRYEWAMVGEQLAEFAVELVKAGPAKVERSPAEGRIRQVEVLA